MKEIWVAEYSPSQKAFHRQPINETVDSNIRRLKLGEVSDYMIIGYGSMETCGKIIEKAKAILR